MPDDKKGGIRVTACDITKHIENNGFKRMPYIESEGYLDFFKNNTFMNVRLVLFGDDNASHMKWPKTCVQVGVSPDNEDALLRSLVTVMRIKPDIIRLTGSFAEIDAQNNNEEENHD